VRPTPLPPPAGRPPVALSRRGANIARRALIEQIGELELPLSCPLDITRLEVQKEDQWLTRSRPLPLPMLRFVL